MSARPSLHLSHRGLVIGWSSPLGPAVARFETWTREAPVFARTLGHPGLDRPIAPLLWPAPKGIVAIWCEEEGAFSKLIADDGAWASPPTLVVPGARAIALAPGSERATLFAADEAGIVRVELDVHAAPVGSLRRCVAERRAGAMLEAVRVRDEAILVFAHRGVASLGVVATKGVDEEVVRHPLGEAPLGAQDAGRDPALELERSGMTLGSPRVLWTEDRWTLLAHRRGEDRLVVRSLDEGGAKFDLPRCSGHFDAAYWTQRFFALEVAPQGDGGQMRLFCSGRDGSGAQQRVTELVLDDRALRRRRIATREALGSLAARLSRASYRDSPARTRLAREGTSVDVEDEEGTLTVGVAHERTGVRLHVHSALEGPAPPPVVPTRLARLSRWIRLRISAEARAREAAERAFGEEHATELDASLLRFVRVGRAIVLELALSALPEVERLERWLRALRKAQRERLPRE